MDFNINILGDLMMPDFTPVVVLAIIGLLAIPFGIIGFVLWLLATI